MSSGFSTCIQCANFEDELRRICRTAETRGFALAGEIARIAQVRSFRTEHKAKRHY